MYAEFRKIRYALAVAQTRSFTGAAEKLHISQSAISEQVRLLEEIIGFPLFRRSSRGIGLTDQGQSFLQEAERVFDDALNLSETARRIRDGAEIFSIGIGSGLSTVFTEAFLVDFRQAFPGVRLDIFTEPTRRIYEDLHGERIDVGVAIETHAEEIPAGLAQIPFLATDMVMICAPGHALATEAGPVSIERIAQESLVMNELTLGYGEVVQSMFADGGHRLTIAAIADNIDTMMALVARGIGIAVAPMTAVRAEADSGRLNIIPVVPTRAVRLCLVRRQRPMPANRETYFTTLKSMI